MGVLFWGGAGERGDGSHASRAEKGSARTVPALPLPEQRKEAPEPSQCFSVLSIVKLKTLKVVTKFG